MTEQSAPTTIATTVKNANANQRAVRAIVIGTQKAAEAAPGQSTALPNDPFAALMHQGDIIEPPFDMLTLAMLPEHNSELGQVIEAMETNIDGFGYRFVPRIRVGDPATVVPENIMKEMRAEHVELTNFFAYAALEDSFTTFRRKVRKDLETTGNGYFEVIRNAAGKIQGFTHIPSYQLRLGKIDDNAIEVDWPIMEMQQDGSVKVSTIKRWKRFRKFAQSRFVTLRNLSTLGGAKVRWFKEFGDPRQYNNETGELLDAKKASETPIERLANEMVHMKIYCARSPYGLPRYIGNLLSIFGDRAAEEINYVTFRNNNIPSMMVLVSNGQLTEGSIKRIESFVESQIQGSDNYSKFLLLEAEGALEGEDPGQIKLAIEPLVNNQHKDALFQNYSANNQDKVRRAFRIPPIFVGRSDDYTRATAESSRVLADEQIFAPEREEFDGLINRIIFPQMGIVYHKFKSNTPNTTDNTELIGILNGAEKTGALTPRIARNIMEDILGIDLPPFSEGFPADVPFSQTMAEAVKNYAQPNEVGQQVTALKVLKTIYGDTDEGEEAARIVKTKCLKCGTESVTTGNTVGDPLVDHLVSLNKRLEKRWRDEVTKVADAESEAEDNAK